MTIVLYAIFGLFALAAAGFVLKPLLRPLGESNRTRDIIVATTGFAVMAFGLGSYLALGQPPIALRALQAPANDDFPGLMASLVQRMHAQPNDLKGWILVGRGYQSLGMNDEAVKAWKRAIDLAQTQGAVTANLWSAYGEALAAASESFTPEAEAAFKQALTIDPKESQARYYLGLAAAAKGHTEEATKYWQDLLADAPADAPYRQRVIDSLAALTAQAVSQGGAAAPDVGAMVAGLAARLDSNPNDLASWQRLIRAYAVLGQQDKAKDALTKARTTFAGNAEAMTALATSARENNLP